jgi:hypothetical protein
VENNVIYNKTRPISETTTTTTTKTKTNKQRYIVGPEA